MSQWYMMDTNTVSYVVKGTSRVAREKPAGLENNQIAYISTVTEAELRYGIAKRPNSAQLRSSIEGFFAKIQILDWGRKEAIAYGQLRAEQELAGKTLGNLDLLIAAHAIAVGAVLVTNDKAFTKVADLPGTANWATDL